MLVKLINDKIPLTYVFSVRKCIAGEGGGVIQGTASEAVLVALLAARDKVLRRIGRDAMVKLVVYSSDQTHSALQKACQVLVEICRCFVAFFNVLALFCLCIIMKYASTRFHLQYLTFYLSSLIQIPSGLLSNLPKALTRSAICFLLTISNYQQFNCITLLNYYPAEITGNMLFL